jgi:hypothetical protein
MSSQKVTQASEVRVSLRLEGWKVAIATGTAVVLAPVIGLVLLVLLATMLPVLPLVPILFAGFWWCRPQWPPTSTPARVHVFPPRISHHPAAP